MSDRKNNFDFSRQSWPKQPSAERVVGERGRKELPPGTKGGENMKPDRHAEHKQHAFDSFCKKVLKCEACNGYREISRRKKHSIPFSELPEDAMEQLAAYDRYPWEYNTFILGGDVILCDVTRSVSKMTEIEGRGGKRWDKPKKAEKSRDCGGGKF